MSETDDLLDKGNSIGSPEGKKVETQKLLFEGPLADWSAIRRNDFGEVITPHHLFIGAKKDRPHQVAWIERRGMNFETGEPHDYYHIACDCMLEAELRQDHELMFACEAVITAITSRAVEVGRHYGLPGLLQQPNTVNQSTNTLKLYGKQIAAGTIENVLKRDQIHPQNWVANFISGRHEIPILSAILGREAGEVGEFISMLEKEDRAERSGSSVKLTTQFFDEDTLA